MKDSIKGMNGQDVDDCNIIVNQAGIIEEDLMYLLVDLNYTKDHDRP
ncbi:hypothetical protein RchiOBHm_Chr4g0428281 [Rosa chinensis]|uniref:Uncharacterized protein n=1 Tax=Rosa chinensis TaxID=74649 RepID=A0A2P6R013_ROSCH|nr:hypothetical protein RchiOBHm_Chr4g0428281 [Rosa chinensis]